MALATIIISSVAIAISAWAIVNTARANRTLRRAREVIEQPSPVIRMSGTIPAETARELGERLKREMAKAHPWKPL